MIKKLIIILSLSNFVFNIQGVSQINGNNFLISSTGKNKEKSLCKDRLCKYSP